MEAIELMDSLHEQGVFKDVEYDSLHTGTGLKINTHRAIVYADSKVPVSIVSNGYKLVTNQEICEKTIAALEQSTIDLSGSTVQAEFGSDGARCLTRFRFPAHTFTIRGDDSAMLEIIVRNSYDLSWGYMMRAGALRFFCWNGMVLGNWLSSYMQKHTQALDVEHAATKLVDVIDTFKDSEGVWQAMDKTQVSNEFAYRALSHYGNYEPGVKGGLADLESLKRPNLTSKLYKHYIQSEVPALGSTAFAVYNAMTHDATHRKVSSGATTRENRHIQIAKVIDSNYWQEEISPAQAF